MRLETQQQKSLNIKYMSSQKKDLNLTIKIYMSKEVAEKLIVIILTFIFGLPLAFFTALYVSKKALHSLPLETNYEYQIQKLNDAE